MSRKGVKSKSIVKRIPITRAQNHLGEVVKGIRRKREYVILEKDGVPVVGIMDIEEFEDYLEVQDLKVQVHIRKGRAEYQAGKSFQAKDLVPELERIAERAWRKPGRKHAANECAPAFPSMPSHVSAT